MNSYSQTKEDILFQEFFGNYKGSLLSIGENDGKKYSNALALIEKGWIAILVEPSPTVFPKLSNLHAGNANVNCFQVGVGSINNILTFYESGTLLNEGDLSLVSTLKKEETLRWTASNIPFEEKQVFVVTFDKLLEMSPIKTFDFISIDIEGMELEVLPQIDFNSLKTKLICVENNGKDLDKFNNIILPFGFELIHTNAENLIYAKVGFKENNHTINAIPCLHGHTLNGVLPSDDISFDEKVCDCDRIIFFKESCSCPLGSGYKIKTRENNG